MTILWISLYVLAVDKDQTNKIIEQSKLLQMSTKQEKIDFTDMRDPFRTPDDLNAPKEQQNPLLKFPLDQLRLIAILTGFPQRKVLVADPSNATYSLTIGSKIGNLNGVIHKIYIDSIEVKEKIIQVDGFSKELTRTLHLLKKSESHGNQLIEFQRFQKTQTHKGEP